MPPTILQKLRSLASEHEGSLALIGAALPIGCAKGSTVEPARGADSSAQAAESQDAGTDTLVEMFRDGSPEDVAAALEAMVEASADATVSDAGKARGVNPVRPRPQPTADWSKGAPMYKGVSF